MRPDPLSRDAAGAGWLPLGDAALLAPGVTVPSDAMGDAPWGVDDVVSAFGDTAVYFDPLRIAAPAAADWARSAASDTTRTGRLAKLPVCYGGEFGPDLEGLAERAGLAISEVVRRHHSAEYRVGAVGFRPGFPYLVGLDPRLHTPRLGDPRTTVPAGSVAIGGAYTGVYPEASPGGWNVIGRTPRRMHDPGRQRPALVATGDVVRFRPIDRAAFDELVEPATTQPVTPRHGQPTLRVVSPGAVSVLLTLGQPGRRAEGVTAGGAMDPWSHRLANTLVGSDEDAPALEATLTGPVLEALRDVTVAVTGAVSAARRVRLGRGERLDLRRLVGGVRAYVAVAGRLEGEPPRSLVAGDELSVTDVRERHAASWTIPPASIDDPAVLRFIPGPDLAAFEGSPWEAFIKAVHTASPRSDRMGVRLDTPIPPPRWPSDAASRPAVRGLVQVPPDGRPIVLGADCQTIGGYPAIGCVASVDWPTLGQLRPGARVRFRAIDLPTAINALQEQRREFDHLRAGVAARDA